MDTSKSSKSTIYLPVELADQLRAVAWAADRSVNSVVRDLLRRWLAELPGAPRILADYIASNRPGDRRGKRRGSTTEDS